MRASIPACVLLAVLAAPAPRVRAEVTVSVRAGGLDIMAHDAPLSEVLAQLASATGMTVLYDGPEPRDLVTLSLTTRSAVEAVDALLRERTLNFALALNALGDIRR